MNLKEKILNNLKEALKQGEKEIVSVLRMLVSSINNLEIERKKREGGLANEEVVEVVAREIKKRKDAIEQYEKGGRSDLADKEKREVEILQEYMPEQMSEEEVRVKVKEIIDSGVKEFGMVMGKVMPEVKGKADGAMVAKIVKQELSA
jgi:hypothetical protein